MTQETSHPAPRLTPGTARARARAEREARLAAAMRENLRRRKAQQRARRAVAERASRPDPGETGR